MNQTPVPHGLTAAKLARVQECFPRPPAVAVILGSGFSAALSGLSVEAELAYADIPGFPRCGVPGHAGALRRARSASGEVALFCGRLHSYEGLTLHEVAYPVDLAAALGARVILLTCAVGGIRADLGAGSLVAVSDHINLTGGPGLAALVGSRFLDMTAVYEDRLQSALGSAAAASGVALADGVLACVPGPLYETPAEVRMLKKLGADMVCMSTVPEAIRARALGLRVAAIACVANRAAGLEAGRRLDHEDVLQQVGGSVGAGAAFFAAAVDILVQEAGESSPGSASPTSSS